MQLQRSPLRRPSSSPRREEIPIGDRSRAGGNKQPRTLANVLSNEERKYDRAVLAFQERLVVRDSLSMIIGIALSSVISVRLQNAAMSQRILSLRFSIFKPLPSGSMRPRWLA